MITCLDVETTTREDGRGKDNPSPMVVGNQLVSVGWETSEMGVGYVFFYHSQREPTPGAKEVLQKVLDQTELLVGHNIKFDLMWLRSCGFTYTGKLFDTMTCQYILNRAIKKPLSLKEVVKEYGLEDKKTDLTQDYLDKGVGFDRMPPELVEEYGRQDVKITFDLARKQAEEFGGLEAFI